MKKKEKKKSGGWEDRTLDLQIMRLALLPTELSPLSLEFFSLACNLDFFKQQNQWED